MSQREISDSTSRNEDQSVLVDTDSVVTVCKLDENQKKEVRIPMKYSEYYKKIDASKHYTFCSKCEHDIDKHAAVSNYKVELAGKCTVRNCRCKHYAPGRTKTGIELENEKKEAKKLK